MKLIRLYTNSFKGLSTESWMLALVMLINRSGSMVLPFLGVYMINHLHFSIENTGVVLSFFGIGSVIGSWLGGFITDKIGEYKVQSLSLLLSVPLFCLIPVFNTEAGVAAIILLQSIVSESFRPANSVAITKYAKPENITRAFSLNRMAVNLGFSIGPALGGILSAISYEFLFLCNALAALLAGILYIIFFRKRNKLARLKVKKVYETVELKKESSPYHDGKFMVYCLLCMVFSICFFQLFSTLTIFYKDSAHLSQQNIGYILGYSGFLVVLLEMGLVQVAEKYFSLAATMFLGALICGLSYALLGFSHHMVTLVVSMSLLCVGEIWALPFMSTITALRAGKNNKGAYMGLNGISFSIAFIITPSLGTWIAEKFGFTVLWIGTGLVLIIVAIAFYCVVPWMLRHKRVVHD
ncbi:MULTISPECIES: MFS transporter [Chryseobacterium]|uniref:MFS family arabinose efflux permease n=1 Tax=Chryseobacterium camelliae TaxID=1265445 RepID=A0ABU0TJ41_9FLAO|nr:MULTISPECIES: MFS transporter [Chryseobacterium]MDT3409081.1 putative MFS family arabinose efflux permease [Pseudacidovorax intermedius]MDQ1097061.1 putative MFS family arabinose efflux permease [Chryseobacterium camelliae]MDQ1100999.1 putative MFS family arabinose efflux permease [Chryseobacterium sp. SORGH_AS_1048]MDR6084441.1 putative MFS family arabinose efflux permease [Chryseobacterium sp. SORGH_AS_0909]MDR6132712.1 putative MFS family arabinose efflux permease [Chryseobacterium sp. S